MSLSPEQIEQRVAALLAELPGHVTLVAAAKGRTPEEVAAAVAAGVGHVGHNYVQEARSMREALGQPVQWHMIGHLQRNKAALAVQVFDMVQTVDSERLAKELDRRCAERGQNLAVLIEVNSGREAAKAGVLPEEVEALARAIARLPHLQLRGLMTMGPLLECPDAMRPYFRLTRQALEHLEHAGLVAPPPILSMGMSASYRVAIEEGANMLRLGTEVFGPRPGGPG